MKYIIIILLFLPITVFAQNAVTPQGNNHTLIINKGSYQVDSVLFIPHRNDNDWYGKYGDLRINPNSGNLEFRKNNQWVEVGATSAIPHYLVEEFPGQAVGSSNHYVLTHSPLINTVKVMVNGVSLPLSWYAKGANEVAIMQAFYSIDNTDIVQISYIFY